ncbi:MAG: hypothetical protein A3G75_14205 [Verrucomicrobia bacterium RIFCSPLOWO2_12_FULL_64_8]|nr:MAG: hypothetical protein A3G75_14205 [Verrucomicrobia bacterium RIFCSPLOWO2_12_FULL_64_8]
MAALALAAGGIARAQSTVFTYQGQLKQGGAPLDGAVDLRFWLYDGPDPRLGTLVAGALNVTNVAVANGLFSATIDFGAAAFAGERWLQIAVASPAGSGSFYMLAPRQALTPAPFAIQTRGIFVNDPGNVGVGTTAPDGKLHISSGPAWTDNGWKKSLTLDTGAAIELGRIGTTKYGLGVTGNTFYFFRTTADGGAGSGPANYVLAADATGRVGLGTTAPSERLDLGGGNIAMGYEIVYVGLFDAQTVNAMCPAGKRVIGGGCLGVNDNINHSAPFNDPSTPEYDATGWRCHFSSAGGDKAAVAICANIR